MFSIRTIGMLIKGWDLELAPGLLTHGGIRYQDRVLIAMIRPGLSFQETVNTINEETTHIFTIVARWENDRMLPTEGQDKENEVLQWLWPIEER